MASKIDCVAEVLGKRMDAVDQSKNFVEADKMQRLPNKVWILVELRYDQTRGLTIDRISESKEMKPDIQPPYDSFKDKTENYRNDAHVKGLLKLINDDIQRTCK